MNLKLKYVAKNKIIFWNQVFKALCAWYCIVLQNKLKIYYLYIFMFLIFYFA